MSTSKTTNLIEQKPDSTTGTIEELYWGSQKLSKKRRTILFIGFD